MILRPLFCLSGLMTRFIHLFPFKTIQVLNLNLQVKSALWENFWGFMGILDP